MSTERSAVPGFSKSEIPPRETAMNAQLIRSMAESHSGFSEDELQEKLSDHDKFIASGGGDGQFAKLHVAGLPMNIYQGAGFEGSHFEARMKKFLPERSLAGVNLAYADFSGTICENVDFSGAILDGAIFTDAFLANANFEGASAKGTDFTGSDLTNASFKNANLEEADFEISNCANADFTDAIMESAVFPGANLENIKR